MSRKIENLILMPSPPRDGEELLANLRPGGGREKLKFGYLGNDEDLETLIASDTEKLLRLGITHEQLAKAIEDLFTGDAKEINGNHIVRQHYIHSPVCPWGEYTTTSPFDYSKHNTQLFVLNNEQCPSEIQEFLKTESLALDEYPLLVENDWAMIFSDLHPHLIREHKFLQGQRTPYRVDPERAVRYLGIK